MSHMNRSRCKEPEYLAKKHKHDADVLRCSAKDPRYSATLSLSFSLFFSRSRTLSLSFSLYFSCSRTLFLSFSLDFSRSRTLSLSFTSIQVRPSDEQLWVGMSCHTCMDHVSKSPNILQKTPDILQECVCVCVSLSFSCSCSFPLSITRIQVRKRNAQL